MGRLKIIKKGEKVGKKLPYPRRPLSTLGNRSDRLDRLVEKASKKGGTAKIAKKK